MTKRTIYLIAAMLVTVIVPVYAQDFVTDSLKFRSSVLTDPSELLRGQVSGVWVSSTDGNPVGQTGVHVRGISSIYSSGQPLWIVDGVMVSQNLTDNADAFWQYGEQSYTSRFSPLTFLAPSEIESVQILKNATATALYGADGANGVIIVNTRMNRHSERQVQWDSNVGLLTGEKINRVVNNHHLSFSGAANNNLYNLSATFRDIKGLLPGSLSRYGTLKADYRTNANRIVWCGFNSLLSVGSSSSPTATAFVGRPSMGLAFRDEALSSTSYEDWVTGFDDDGMNYRMIASAFIQFNIMPSLKLRVNGGIDAQYDRRVLYYDVNTDFGAVSQENANGGRASNMMSAMIGYNVEADLQYNRYFARSHELLARVSFQAKGNRDRHNTMNGYNFPLDILRGKSLNVGTYPVQIHRYDIDYFRYGMSASASYSYKSLVGADVAFRADDTCRYGKEGWQYYPSANVYLDLKNLLMPGQRTVTALRVEGGYGWSGYEKYLPYDLVGNMVCGGYFKPESGNEPFYDGLARLKTKEWHAGASISVLDGRFLFSSTWFDRTADDRFLMYQMGRGEEDEEWSFAGCSLVDSRQSVIRNYGLELSARSQIIRSARFSWDVSANFTFCRSRIMALAEGDKAGIYIGKGLYADVMNMEKASPQFFGGLGTSLHLHGFVLELQLEGAAGHELINLNKFVKDNPDFQPGMVSLDSDLAERADYLRLGHLGVSYNVPLKKTFVKALSVRLTGHNIATISGYSGWNPDVNSFGYRAAGLDYGSYPLARTFMLGISATF